jgi:tyrosyl-tRNA synthetase
MSEATFPDVDEQLRVLKRGVVDLEVEGELRAKLEKSKKEGRPLTVKAGFDPTAPDLHLGHTVLLNKMRQFQELGHRAVFLVGDFTARIGDPSGKSVTRPPLTEEEIIANAATYKRQVFKVMDPEKTVIQFNSEWLSKMGFDDVIRLSAKYSVARMIERDDFEKRLATGKTISMHELLYPLAQGYDSVAMKADVELGGTDQRFNLLVGRDLMRAHDQSPQVIMTVPILEGTDARAEGDKVVGAKMSKSLGNYVGVEESPDEQYGKVMSICDPLMWRYFDLLSFQSNEAIADYKAGHPMEAKDALAREIVARFHSEQAAETASANFKRNFDKENKNAVPDDAPTIRVAALEGGLPIINVLVEAQLCDSNSAAKRLIKQGGLAVDGARIKDLGHKLDVGKHAIRAGKKKWAHVVVEP